MGHGRPVSTPRSDVKGTHMADMSNEKWLAALRIELSQAGRWVEITSQTADRLEESDRQLAEYRNTPTTDDSELQGELELVREELDSLRKERHDAWKAASEILLLHGCDDTSLTDGVQQLSDKLTEERKRSAEYVKLIGDMYQVCRSHGFPRDGGDEYEAVRQLADALTAERAKVVGLEKRLYDTTTAANRDVADLQHELETERAAAAQRAQESQLEPVGWAHIGPDNGQCYFFRDRRQSSYDIPADGMYDAVEAVSDKGTARRVYLGPAEPLEVPQ